MLWASGRGSIRLQPSRVASYPGIQEHGALEYKLKLGDPSLEKADLKSLDTFTLALHHSSPLGHHVSVEDVAS